jgi:hypothetical protein
VPLQLSATTPTKSCYLSTKLHGVTTQKTVTFKKHQCDTQFSTRFVLTDYWTFVVSKIQEKKCLKEKWIVCEDKIKQIGESWAQKQWGRSIKSCCCFFFSSRQFRVPHFTILFQVTKNSTIYNTGFNTQSLNFAHTVYLCVSYHSHSKQRLLR